MTTCIKCDRQLHPQEGPGRPRRWCSVGCRRAAEYELRRLVRRLDDVEGQLPAWRRACDRGLHPHGGSLVHARQVLDDLEADRVELEDRMRLLLDDDHEEKEDR